jgi:hypothetical protein
MLMPERPRDDLLNLAASQDIAVLWPAENGRFDRTNAAA